MLQAGWASGGLARVLEGMGLTHMRSCGVSPGPALL